MLCSEMGINPIIKPRINARVDKGPSSAIMFKTFGEKKWGQAKVKLL
jgi:hypothetical protein